MQTYHHSPSGNVNKAAFGSLVVRMAILAAAGCWMILIAIPNLL